MILLLLIYKIIFHNNELNFYKLKKKFLINKKNEESIIKIER